MYINTTDACSIIVSLAEILDIDRIVLENIRIEENAKEKLEHYLLDNINESMIDEILIHHLSRRINGITDTIDLHTLLLSENAFSNYLKAKGIVFELGSDAVDIIYNGAKIDIDSYKYNPGVNKSRLKQRLCRNDNLDFKDSMINGYVIGNVDNDRTYHFLAEAPEIIHDLSYLFGDYSIKNEYSMISKFYIWSYKIPFKDCKYISGNQFEFKDLIKTISSHISDMKTNKYITAKKNDLLNEKNLISKYYPNWAKPYNVFSL